MRGRVFDAPILVSTFYRRFSAAVSVVNTRGHDIRYTQFMGFSRRRDKKWAHNFATNIYHIFLSRSPAKTIGFGLVEASKIFDRNTE